MGEGGCMEGAIEPVMMGRGGFSLIAQTTGVSLIPSFPGSDREMRGLFFPILLPPLPRLRESLLFTPFSTKPPRCSPLGNTRRRPLTSTQRPLTPYILL